MGLATRLEIRLFRLPQFFQSCVRLVRPRAARGKLQKPPPMMLRLDAAVQILENPGQVVVHIRVIVVQRQGTSVGRDRQFGLARFRQHTR